MNLSRYLKISVFSIFICNVLLMTWSAPAMADEELTTIPIAEENLILPYAASAVLIEAHTGQVLFELNSTTPLPPASTTKILTALLAINMEADMDKQRTISDQAAAVGDMSLHLRAGEKLTLRELIQGALVHSGNDACYAIGETIAGSEPLFVYWMNMKSAVLGAYSIHAANTNGLPDNTHLMSAADLARISRYAMKEELFTETVNSKYIQIGEGISYRKYQNTNKLLWQDENISGIKTGTTDAAGPCLVAAYEDGAATYISVVLNSPDRYGESYSLLKYAAGEYMLISFPCAGRTLVCLPENDGYVRLQAQENICVLVKEDEVEELSWVWHLDREKSFLCLKDRKEGELARVLLTPKEGDK